MKNLLTWILLLLLPVLHASAKQTRFYGNGQLSCNLITTLCQDGNEFIWIGTANGLNKFDGWTFTSYFNNDNDSTSLLSNYIICSFKDSNNDLWIGSNKGLQCYLPYEDSFRTVQFPGGEHPTVETIIELHTGEIWVATAGWGLFSIDKKQMQAISLTEINEFCGTLAFDPIYQDRSNSIWITMPNRRVLRIVSGPEPIYQVFETPDGTIDGFAEDAEGRLLASTYSQIAQWEPVSRTFIPLKNTIGNLLSPIMLPTHKGTIYVGTNGQGLGYINTDRMETTPVDDLISREINLGKIKVASLLEDNKGNIWVGCFRGGVLMIPNEEPLFHFWDFSSMKYESEFISCIYKGKDGRIWAGAENRLLMELQENGQVKAAWPQRGRLSSMLEDSDGTFWTGSHYSGIGKFNKATGQAEHLPQHAWKYIKCITEGKDRKVYFSTFGEGITVYDLATGSWRDINGTTPLNNDIRLKNMWVNTIICDSKGRMWMGHYSGISCYDPESDLFHSLACDSVLHKTICYTLLEDKRENIWIGTSHGLFRYSPDAGSLVHYATNESLPDNVICGLAEDADGNIWCSTFKGIRKISPADGKILSFLSGSGLYDKEYTRGVHFQDEDGDIYFGGAFGITRFSPEEVVASDITQTPVLTELYLNNIPVSVNTQSELILSHEDNTFSLGFSMMDFRDPGNIRYEYRLQDTDNIWTYLPSGSNRITYNRLSPGKYTIDVRANENGVYSPVKSLTVVITPPWYASWVAKICYFLLLIGSIVLVSYWQYRRLQKKRLEEINEEKMKFFINISHEIRSPLTLIISPLSMLIKREYDEVTTKALHSMYRNANRIVTLINQLLDIRRIDKGLMKIIYSKTNLVTFIEELIQIFDYQANKRLINLSFEHDMESLPVWIDRNNFDKVLVNLIGNAFKFTEDRGSITLSLTAGEDKKMEGPLNSYAEIRVTDSGSGLDEKTADRIFERFYQDKTNPLAGSGIGLHLCKTLIELHHGEITAANREDGKGSCFTIRIPLGNSHLNPEELLAEDSAPRFVLNQNLTTEMLVRQKKQSVKSKTRNKVLVIDDSEELLHYLDEELNVLYKVITCNNAIDGLRVALEEKPDLIISDVVMPEMDGFALLKKVKTNGNISHIPVILLTSKTEYDNRIKGWDKGADAILTKPFNMEELVLICSNLIASRLRLKGKFTGIQDQEDKAKPIEIKSNDEQFMERLMLVINKNMDNPEFNVESLAREVGISRVQLHRKLKDIAGIPSSEFLRNIRLKHAAELLKSRKINVSQVGYEIGYANPALFSIAFKKYYGVSPTEYVEKSEYE